MKGEPYQPSNGTSFEYFCDDFCYQCINCDPNPDGEKQCEILGRAFFHSVKDKEYPTEWTHDDNNKPTCTEWVKWDWGNDGDPDDPENPKAPPPPPDPNQIDLFPLYPDETNYTKHTEDYKKEKSYM